MVSETIRGLEKFNKEINVEQFIEYLTKNMKLDDMDYYKDKDVEFAKTILRGVKASSPTFRAKNINLDIMFESEYRKHKEEYLKSLHNVFTSAYQIYKWLEFKQIYKFDADTLEMLREQETKDMSYDELKALRMPFNSFAIENRFRVATVDESTSEIYKIDVISTIVSRKVFKNGSLLLSFYSIVDDDDMGIYSIDFLVEENESLFQALKKESEETKKYILFFINLMLYLSQPKVEILVKKKNNATKENKKVKSLYGINYTENEIGVRLGNAIRNYRVLYEKGSTLLNPNDTKRIVKPHIRCGHFQKYWVGKGRVDLITKYIEPIFVLGGSNKATLHNVK